MSSTHLILVTHTPERLRRTLLGAACQSTKPDTIVLACDADHDSIRDAAQESCNEFDISLILILRTACGVSRSAQVRNNAVRELLTRDAQPSDAVIFLDGDCVPERDLVQKHTRALKEGEMVLGGRFEMTPQQDKAFDEEALRVGYLPISPTTEQFQALASRRKRLNRHAQLRRLGLHRLGLLKPHKPKLLVGASSFKLEAYHSVNGMDETYVQWGQEDDDLARRFYQWGGRPVIMVGSIHTFHQYHPSRAPGNWHESPNANRLSAKTPTRCEHGLENPLEQPDPVVEQLHPQPAATAQ